VSKRWCWAREETGYEDLSKSPFHVTVYRPPSNWLLVNQGLETRVPFPGSYSFIYLLLWFETIYLPLFFMTLTNLRSTGHIIECPSVWGLLMFPVRTKLELWIIEKASTKVKLPRRLTYASLSSLDVIETNTHIYLSYWAISEVVVVVATLYP
jgi:hypothetical protein